MSHIEVDLQGNAAIEFIMSQAATPLSKAWDGGFERVGFVFQGGDRVAVGFLDRAAMIAELGRRAAAAEVGGDELRGIAGQLDRGPTAQVQCVLHACGGLALIEIHPDDLRALPDLTGAGSPAEFAFALHQAASAEGARELVARVRARVIAAVADAGSPPAPSALHAVGELVAAVGEQWDDISAVSRAVATALEATGPLTPTSNGQHIRMLLGALAEAVAQRPPVGFVRARGGAA